MRIYLYVLLLLLSTATYAQQLEEKSVESIAEMERLAHQRLTGAEILSFSSNNFDVNYYRCEWSIDPAIRYIDGKVTVYFTLTSATSSITLDLMSPLVADSVKQRNAHLVFSQPSNTLVVNFPSSRPAGTLDSVSIYYKGVPPNTGFGSFILSGHLGTPVMWTLSEPYGARDWWPCKNGLDDKADSIDIIVTHPSIYKAASNGLLQSELPAGPGKTATFWKHRYPIATYLVAIAVTNYEVFNNTVQLGNTILPMQTHCYPESKTLFQANTSKVLDAMQLFHGSFGDYPFIREKYGHVQFGWGGGMEHQTATFLVTPDESLMAHELGHQWFGDKVTTATWTDIWLNEGFATFSAAYHMETKYPATRIQNRRSVVNNITSLPGGSVKVIDTLDVGRIFSSRLSYNKGSYLVVMLRFMLGDEVFFRAVKKYLQDPAVAYGFARTADLKRVLEAESGKDLTKFFDQWYTGEGYPTYNVEWSQLGSTSVRIKMNQVTSHPSVPFYEMPVPLTFKKGTQETTVIVDHKINGEFFTRDIGFIADTVLVDPEYWLISRNNTTMKTSFPNTGNGVVEIRPIPATDPFTVYLHDFSSSTARIQVFNAAGQRVYNKQLNLVNGAEYLQLPVNHWSRGMYTIRVDAGNQKVVQQFIR